MENHFQAAPQPFGLQLVTPDIFVQSNETMGIMVDFDFKYNEKNEWEQMKAFPLQCCILKILWNQGLRSHDLRQLQTQEQLDQLSCWSYLLDGQRHELKLLLEINNDQRHTVCLQEIAEHHRALAKKQVGVIDEPEEVLLQFRSSLQRNLPYYMEGTEYSLKITETDDGRLGGIYLCLLCMSEIKVMARISDKQHKIGVQCSTVFRHVRSHSHRQLEKRLLTSQINQYIIE